MDTCSLRISDMSKISGGDTLCVNYCKAITVCEACLGRERKNTVTFAVQ